MGGIKMSKNRLISLTGLLALLLLATGPLLAAQGFEPVIEKAVAGRETAQDHPVEYLLDGQAATYWGFRAGTEQGWAEFTLDQEYLIIGLELSGQLAEQTSLRIEYQSEQGWQPFLAGEIRQLNGREGIDLSADRVVTKRIRLKISGRVGNSRLTELKVSGRPVQHLYQYIKVKEVAASENTSPTARAEFLLDGNTYTSWQLESPFRRLREHYRELKSILSEQADQITRQQRLLDYSGGEVLFRFASPYLLNQVNLYFTKYARGEIVIEAEQEGAWQEIARIRERGIRGWYQVDLSKEPLETAQVRLKVKGYNRHLGGISEVQFWGWGKSSGPVYRMIGVQQRKSLAQPLNRYFDLTAEEIKDYYLELAVAAGPDGPLTIEINGQEETVPLAKTLRGYNIYRYRLDARELWVGRNFLRINPPDHQPLSVLNLRLQAIEYTGHQSHNLRELNDGLLGSTVQEQLVELELANSTLLTGVEVYSRADGAAFSLTALVKNNWVSLTQATKENGMLRYGGGVETTKLRIENPGRYPIEEVVVLGSAITDRPPKIRILQPTDGELIKTWGDGFKYLVGFVDNQQARIRVNGRPALTDGHYFYVLLNLLGILDRDAGNITAVATDRKRRESSHSINVQYDFSPIISIDQGPEIHYTDQPAFTISGRLRKSHYQVLLNGQPVETSRGYFSSSLPLEEGFNLIKISCQRRYGRGTREAVTLYRKVFYYPGQLELSIDTPEQDSYTAREEVVIRGTVQGLGSIEVKVNGQTALLDGDRYSSLPIALSEGENIIVVEASDQQGSRQQELRLIQDTIAPVISEVLPAEGAIVSSPQVTVSGRVSEINPYYVYTNQRFVPSNGERFQGRLTLAEATEQVLTVRAVDLAGNETLVQRRIMVDLTPPLPFTILAEPSGWTNQRQALLRFATTDQLSGVKGYQLALNEGEYGAVTSPHQLTLEQDGIHLVTVKASDRAGWERTASTRLYLDTVAPAPPEDFRAVAGIEQGILRWQGSGEEDVVAYHLYRYPAWPSGDYQVIPAVELQATARGELEYLDNAVFVGQEYNYYLQAVDRAGNHSTPTPDSTVQIGRAEQEVSPEEEEASRLEYQDVRLLIPPQAVPEHGTIEIVAVEQSTIQENINLIVSNTYNFEFRDSSEQPKEEVTFKKPLTIEMAYDQELIPAGYSIFDLNIYYYSENEGRWIKLIRTGLDPTNGIIAAQTDHFSAYNVQLTKNYSPAVEEYEELGLSPYQSYFKNNQEYVAPASGGLTIKALDLAIPGRNGLDLQIGRSFDSRAIVLERLKLAYNPDQPVRKYTCFGTAWRINLPWIEKNDDGTFIYFEDGSSAKIEWARKSREGLNSLLQGNYYQGRYFTAEKVMVKKGELLNIFKLSIGGYWRDEWYRITTKGGKVYHFNQTGMVTRISDQNGNSVNFSYSGRKINWIEDTVGRKAIFYYDQGKISRISYGKQQFHYHYQGQNLSKVIDPVGRETLYDYSSETVRFGGTGNIKRREIPLVEQITYPGGGLSRYEYSVYGIRWYGTEEENNWSVYDRTTVAVDRHYQLLHPGGEELNRQDYSYQFNLPAEKYESDIDDLEGQRFRITVCTNSNLRQKTIMSYDHDQLLSKKEVLDSADHQLKEYRYLYDRKLKEVTREQVYQDGGTIPVYTIEYTYDNWGNLIYNHHSGTGRETRSYYYQSNQSPGSNFRRPPFTQGRINAGLHDLLAGRVIHNYDPDGNWQKQEIAYQYDQQGNLQTKASYTQDPTNGLTKWLQSTFRYDRYGNLIKITDPLGNITEMEYSAEFQHAYPTLIKKMGPTGTIHDADGQPVRLPVNKYGYDFDSGLKHWELDPLGNLTEYRYDKINRLVKIIYPDDQDQAELDPARSVAELTPAHYRNRRNNPVKIQHYDDQERVTTVVNVNYNLDLTDPAKLTLIRANGLSPELFNKSKYYYDQLNRYVRLEQYLRAEELAAGQSSPFVTEFSYNRFGEQAMVLDAEGKLTATKYDPLGRISKILYFGATAPTTIDLENDTYPEVPATQIAYNNSENSRTITDPEGKVTVEVKDWADRISRVNKYNDGIEYSSLIKYDQAGNIIQEIDGNAKQTTYYYDDLNRLIKEEWPADRYIQPGNTIPTANTKPTLIYRYDDNGNRIAEINPNGNAGSTDPRDYTTRYYYDQLNRLIKVIDPAGNETKTYYNPAGQEVKVVDAGNNTVQVVYDSRGNQKAVIDGEGNLTYIEYDIIGQKIAEYDPRGVIPASAGSGGKTVEINGQSYSLDQRYKTSYSYDRLGNLIKTIDPLGQVSEIKYDRVGNRIRVSKGEQRIDYHYNDFYFLVEETVNQERKTTYSYDLVGNRLSATNPLGNTTTFAYDDLYQLIKVTQPDGSTTEYGYDRVGNKTWEKVGNQSESRYYYNAMAQLTEVQEKAGSAYINTFYDYDLNGNLVKKEMGNGLVFSYQYNNLGQLIRETKPGNQHSTFQYDRLGNLKTSINPLGVKQEYHYYRNKLLAAIEYFEPDSSGSYPESAAEITSYQYDRLGNRTITEKRSGELLASAINFQYDPLNRVISETRNIDGKEYYTAYQYDQYDNLRKIKYPGSQHWLEYSYDNFNQLKGISELAGELKQTAFRYDQNGSLTGITYNSGVTTSYTLDRNSRVETIEVNRSDLNGKSENILKLNYRYDQAGNIISRNQNQYGYDSLNRLIKAEVSGTIYSERGIDHGYVEADYYGERGIDLAVEGIETITLDYHSGSVGVKFRQIVRNISRIELKSIGGANHRLQADTIDLYSSYDNELYTLIQPESWQFEQDMLGNITIRLPEGVEGQYLKIHSKFDDRDEDFRVVNQGSFTNILRELVKVYQKAEKAELSYSYDRGGNRLSKTIESKQGSMTLHSERINYHYYPGTNRLLSDGEYGYCYDQAGNLIEKGNRYSIANNTITFTARSGNGVEYYQYYYNRQNRLEKVSKNGETVARFSYDPDGKRIKAEERIKESGTNKTTYYVFAFNGQVLLEESSEHNFTSYIYAFGRTFATIAGIVGESKEISYFHYDNVGSTCLMTDQDGKIIMEQDYLPFGGDLPKIGQVEVYNEITMEYKYTGQNEVVSIGLYYYGARYYDPSIGRFITEDSYPGEINNPQSQNLYVYVMNNPLRYIDPTGHMATPVLHDAAGGGWDDEADEVGSIDKPTGGNKQKDNNTNVEKVIDAVKKLVKNLFHKDELNQKGINIEEMNPDIHPYLISYSELNQFYGIEYINIKKYEYTMFSNLVTINETYFTSEFEGNVGVILPLNVKYDAQLFATIKNDKDFNRVIASEYINMEDISKNVTCIPVINIYTEYKIGNYLMKERLFDSSIRRMRQGGFANELDEQEYANFKIPKNERISRIELETAIMINDASFWPIRYNNLSIINPF